MLVARDFRKRPLADESSEQIVESVYRPSIPLDQSIAALLQAYVPPQPWVDQGGNPLRSIQMHKLLRYPYFSREPDVHRQEMCEAYAQVQYDLPLLHRRLNRLIARDPIEQRIAASMNIGITQLRARFQVAYSIVLELGIFLNAILRALDDPQVPDLLLLSEAAELCERGLALCQEMLDLRPLFSSGLPSMLMVAWGAEDDDERLSRLEDMMDHYQPRSSQSSWYRGGAWWRAHREHIRWKAELARDHAGFLTPPMEVVPMFGEGEIREPEGSCTIL